MLATNPPGNLIHLLFNVVKYSRNKLVPIVTCVTTANCPSPTPLFSLCFCWVVSEGGASSQKPGKWASLGKSLKISVLVSLISVNCKVTTYSMQEKYTMVLQQKFDAKLF